ncbi:MAG TPA: hypothetical protein VFC19_49425 [Candidatus Limnocylindrales bacterium]|nr:hypothetical protein [Candidatus Limnocylindrales bacterium]
MIKNQPLFDAPTKPELTLSKTLDKHKAWRGAYARYRPVKRVQCDECVNVLHEAGGKGEPPRAAVTMRTSSGGNLRLCNGHGQMWRKIDGVGEARNKPARRR